MTSFTIIVVLAHSFKFTKGFLLTIPTSPSVITKARARVLIYQTLTTSTLTVLLTITRDIRYLKLTLISFFIRSTLAHLLTYNKDTFSSVTIEILLTVILNFIDIFSLLLIFLFFLFIFLLLFFKSLDLKVFKNKLILIVLLFQKKCFK